jgi:hypothetical protein
VSISRHIPALVTHSSTPVWTSMRAGKIRLYSHLNFLHKGEGGGGWTLLFPDALCFSPCPSNSTQTQSDRKCTAIVVMLLGYRETIQYEQHQIFRAVNAPYYCNYTTHTFSNLFLSNNAQTAGPSQGQNMISIYNKLNITKTGSNSCPYISPSSVNILTIFHISDM